MKQKFQHTIKHLFAFVMTMAIILTGIQLITEDTEAAGNMEAALQWAIAVANDNSHGYSQQNRWGPDYDCSSFVVSALKSAGFDVGGSTWTGNMRSNLITRGFQ